MIIKRFTSVITAASILAFNGIWESALAGKIQLNPSAVNTPDLALKISIKQKLGINISHVTKSQNIISINNGQKEVDKSATFQTTYNGWFHSR